MAIAGGDIASLILYCEKEGSWGVPGNVSKSIRLASDHDIATLVANDSTMMGHLHADGILVEGSFQSIKSHVEKLKPDAIVGCGNVKDRHRALELGELQPDFLFFGRLGGDIKPEPHAKNVKLAAWWSEFVEIPCVILGGDDVESVALAAQSGADFVGLDRAVWDCEDPRAQVNRANALLEAHGRFET